MASQFALKEQTAEVVEMTPDLMREALGIEESPAGTFKIGRKRYVAKHNRSNRPFQPALAKRWMQMFLDGSWDYTGESVSFDTKGEVVSGQHRGIGLLMAEEAIQSGRFTGKRVGSLSFPQVFAYGVKPSAADNTDTGKGRNSADVAFRRRIFKDLTLAEQKKCSSDLSTAQRLLWIRLRGKTVSRGGRQPQQEMLDVLKEHPALETCVRFIFELDRSQEVYKEQIIEGDTVEEDGSLTEGEVVEAPNPEMETWWEETKAAGSIANKISRGYGAGLLYLMAASSEDRDLWEGGKDLESFEGADFAAYDAPEADRVRVYEGPGGVVLGGEEGLKGMEAARTERNGIVVCGPPVFVSACQFWYEVSEPYGLEKGSAVLAWRELRDKMRNDGNTDRDEIVGTTIKAWNSWYSGKNATPAKLKLSRKAGTAEYPVIGGLDVGAK